MRKKNSCGKMMKNGFHTKFWPLSYWICWILDKIRPSIFCLEGIQTVPPFQLRNTSFVAKPPYIQSTDTHVYDIYIYIYIYIYIHVLWQHSWFAALFSELGLSGLTIFTGHKGEGRRAAVLETMKHWLCPCLPHLYPFVHMCLKNSFAVKTCAIYTADVRDVRFVFV